MIILCFLHSHALVNLPQATVQSQECINNLFFTSSPAPYKWFYHYFELDSDIPDKCYKKTLLKKTAVNYPIYIPARQQDQL